MDRAHLDDGILRPADVLLRTNELDLELAGNCHMCHGNVSRPVATIEDHSDRHA